MTFSAVQFIDTKRFSGTHASEDIHAFVSGMMSGEIPDYQVTAWLMAVCCNGLTLEETTALTQAYVASGEILDLSGLSRHCVDKHSTGGVGDKITLILAPILAACGLGVAKLSGRGLGLTGGTIDKLEAIPGFQTNLSKEAFLKQVEAIGVAVVSQTAELAPADGKTYALRDVTATVASIPLIAASVMCKKIAAGAPVITLDVKYGSGAFMATREDAEELAQTCVAIGEQCGRIVVTHLSDMNTPLGSAIGHANEVQEAIDTLKGHGPSDLRQLVLELAVMTLVAAKHSLSKETAQKEVEAVIASGKAIEVFKAFVEAQGGNLACVENPQLLPQPAERVPVLALQSGKVTHCNAHALALAAFALGAGRTKKGDVIDFAVGLYLLKKPGDVVVQGEPLAELLVNQKGLEEAKALVLEAYKISRTHPKILT